MKQLILKVNTKDNVLVALQNLSKGDKIEFEGLSIILQEDIPAKHKFYMQTLVKGTPVIMYGVLVGKVIEDVHAGVRMSTDNLHHASEPFVFKPYDYSWSAPDVSKFANRTFNGYHRADGRVGTANYWLFIPTVFCENRNLDVIKEALHNELGYSVSNQYKNYTKDLILPLMKGKTSVIQFHWRQILYPITECLKISMALNF